MCPVKETHFWLDTSIINDCWVWTCYRDKKGYGLLTWNGRTRRAHHIAWILAYGSVPVGLQVLHKCDNPSCVKPSHLWLGTNADNVRDKMAKNRGCKGEHHGAARLTESDIEQIKTLYNVHMYLQKDIAAAYKIDRSHVSRIVNNKKWSYLCAR